MSAVATATAPSPTSATAYPARTSSSRAGARRGKHAPRPPPAEPRERADEGEPGHRPVGDGRAVGRRWDSRAAWKDAGEAGQEDGEAHPEPGAEARAQRAPGAGLRQAPPANPGEQVDHPDQIGHEGDDEDEPDRPPTDDPVAEIDVPGGPARELDAAVEGSQDRVGGAPEANELGPVERCGRLGDRRPAVRRGGEPDRRDLAAQEGRLLAVAERDPEVDELREPAGAHRLPSRLFGDPQVSRSHERRRG